MYKLILIRKIRKVKNNMKKILSSALVLLLVFSLSLVCFAEDDTISDEQAKDLYKKMETLWTMINQSPVGSMPVDGSKTVVYCLHNDYNAANNSPPYLFEYYTVKDEYNSLEKMQNKWAEVFTDEIASYAFLPNIHNLCEFTVHEGKVCVFSMAAYAPGDFGLYDDIEGIERESGKVVLKVNVDNYRDSTGLGDSVQTHTLEITKGDNGWRISGGSLIDLLFPVKSGYTMPGEEDSLIISAAKDGCTPYQESYITEYQLQGTANTKIKVYPYIDFENALIANKESEKCTLSVNIYSNKKYNGKPLLLMENATIELEYRDEEWNVVGGSYENLEQHLGVSYIPQTSDGSVFFVVLMVLSLLSIGVVSSVKKEVRS